MNALNKEILRLSVPSILANITIPLVGMVDIAVAGHLGGGQGAALIGGITVGSMLFDLLYWNFGFLRAGTGGLTAQAYGRRDFRAAADTLSRSLWIALIAAALLILIQWVFIDLAFLVVKCTPEVKSLAVRYFRIRIWAAPATLSLMAFKGWFIGMQDSASAMICDLVVDLINIAASILLAFGAGRFGGIGYDGVAAGTVIAQYSGLVCALIQLRAKYKEKVFSAYSLGDCRKALKGREMGSFFRLNGDLFIRSVSFIFVYMGFTIIAARYGDVALASSAVLMKLMMFFSYFTDGFAYAGEALTGRYIGERNRPMLRKSVRYTFYWSAGIALIFMVVNGLSSDNLFSIMTSDVQVAEFSDNYVIWMVLVPLVGCPAFLWDGVYVGATAARQLRDATLLSAVGFFGVWFAVGAIRGVLNNTGESVAVPAIGVLMLSYWTHLLIRTLYLSITYRRSVVSRCPAPPVKPLSH